MQSKVSVLKHKNLFLLFVVMFEFAVYISNDMILPALTQIYSQFSAPQNLIPLSLSMFFFGSLMLQLFGGPLSDHFGRRKTMFIGGVIVLVGNFLGIVAPDFISFLVARVFQGMGLCFITVAGYAAVHELFDSKEAVRNIAWMASIALFAPMVGPSLGSLILVFSHWRYIFAFTFAMAFISMIGLYYTMPESLPEQNRVIFKFKSLAPSYLNLIKNKKFMSYSILNAVFAITCLVWIGSSPLLLMNHYGFDAKDFGLIQIPVFLGFMIGAYVLRRLTEKYELLECLKYGYYFIILSMFILFPLPLFFEKNLSVTVFITGMAIYHMGLGIVGGPAQRLILDSTEKLKGIASGFSAFISFMSFGVSLTIIGFFDAQKPWIFSLCLFLPIVLSMVLYKYSMSSEVKN